MKSFLIPILTAKQFAATLATILLLCSHTKGFSSEGVPVPADSTIKILVLPPYDEIANAGVSPDTQTILENALKNKDQVNVIPFPYKKLMNVPYYMVFDKKYCKSIADKVDCDVIIMTQIITDNERKPGIHPWAYKVRVYNTRTGKQLDSINGKNLHEDDFVTDIKSKINKLVNDIALTF